MEGVRSPHAEQTLPQVRKGDSGCSDEQQASPVKPTPGSGELVSSPGHATSGQLVPFQPPGSGFKKQRSLDSYFGFDGPQSPVSVSPEHLTKCAQWEREQAVRMQAALEVSQSTVGQLVAPPLQAVHSEALEVAGQFKVQFGAWLQGTPATAGSWGSACCVGIHQPLGSWQ